MAEVNKPSSKRPNRYSEDMIHECLLIMESGSIEELFEIIPRIGVLRDKRFYRPLNDLLARGDPKRKEFAAYAMGAIGDKAFIEPLKKAFKQSKKYKRFGAQDLKIAIIEAIGAIGDDAAVEFFLPILTSCCADAGSRTTTSAAKNARKMSKWIMESLGAIAQQGGLHSMQALIQLLDHHDPEIQAQALSEISVAYWHRPNEIEDSLLEKIYALTSHHEAMVVESAMAALQSLADVGCTRAEAYFTTEE